MQIHALPRIRPPSHTGKAAHHRRADHPSHAVRTAAQQRSEGLPQQAENYRSTAAAEQHSTHAERAAAGQAAVAGARRVRLIGWPGWLLPRSAGRRCSGSEGKKKEG